MSADKATFIARPPCAECGHIDYREAPEPPLFVGEPKHTQAALLGLTDGELTHLLADLSIHIAYRRVDNPTPQQVLRDGIRSFGWPEDEWPKVRSQVEAWIEAK